MANASLTEVIAGAPTTLDAVRSTVESSALRWESFADLPVSVVHAAGLVHTTSACLAVPARPGRVADTVTLEDALRAPGLCGSCATARAFANMQIVPTATGTSTSGLRSVASVCGAATSVAAVLDVLATEPPRPGVEARYYAYLDQLAVARAYAGTDPLFTRALAVREQLSRTLPTLVWGSGELETLGRRFAVWGAATSGELAHAAARGDVVVRRVDFGNEVVSIPVPASLARMALSTVARCFTLWCHTRPALFVPPDGDDGAALAEFWGSLPQARLVGTDVLVALAWAGANSSRQIGHMLGFAPTVAVVDAAVADALCDWAGRDQWSAASCPLAGRTVTPVTVATAHALIAAGMDLRDALVSALAATA